MRLLPNFYITRLRPVARWEGVIIGTTEVLQRHSHDGSNDCLEYRSDDYECQNPHDWDAFMGVGVDNPFRLPRLKITYVNHVIDTFIDCAKARHKEFSRTIDDLLRNRDSIFARTTLRTQSVEKRMIEQPI